MHVHVKMHVIKECMTQPTLINLHPIEYNQKVNANVNMKFLMRKIVK